MAQANRVHSTPPTNTSPTRRAFINTIAALPMAAAAPAVATQTPDAELIELGARFEALVDRYYVAQRRWSRSLAQAHAEHDREFGDPADRNYEYPPEIVAAFSDSCERSGANEADDVLSAVDAELKQLAKAINASPVNSIEGLRAKALVAFWEVAPCVQATLSFHSTTLIRSNNSSLQSQNFAG